MNKNSMNKKKRRKGKKYFTTRKLFGGGSWAARIQSLPVWGRSIFSREYGGQKFGTHGNTLRKNDSEQVQPCLVYFQSSMSFRSQETKHLYKVPTEIIQQS